MAKFKTREEWLQAATRALRPIVKRAGAVVPPVTHVSVGFPKGGRKGTAHAIGQCFHTKYSMDGAPHMFVSPVLDEPVRVLDVLLHELVHAAVGCEHGHKRPFKVVIKELGLAGKPTATWAEPGTPIHDALKAVAEKLGPYPHSVLQPVETARKGSSWVRLHSVSDEKYTVVISEKSIERFGVPLDPDGEEMVYA